MPAAMKPRATCRCGLAKMQDWHAFCQRCFAKLPYELRKHLRTRHCLPNVVAEANAFLDADALAQAAKVGRLKAS